MSSPIGVVFIATGLLEHLDTLIDRFDREFGLPLIGVQSSTVQFRTFCTLLMVVLIKMSRFVIHDPTSKNRSHNALSCLFCMVRVQFYTLLYEGLHNRLHVILPPRPSRFSACIIEKLGVAWGRGYWKTWSTAAAGVGLGSCWPVGYSLQAFTNLGAWMLHQHISHTLNYSPPPKRIEPMAWLVTEEVAYPPFYIIV